MCSTYSWFFTEKLTALFTAMIAFFTPFSSSAADRSFLFMPDGANFYVYGRGSDSFIINQSRIAELQIDRTMARLSSGQRINSASDDPSGLAVSEKMNTLLNQMKQESLNDEDMKNFYAYAESAAGQDQDLVKRIRELALRASNGILAPDDREIIQTEIDELVRQVDMNAAFSQLNTIKAVPELTADFLGINAVDVVHHSEEAIGIADKALTMLMKKRVLQGVKSNILTFRIEGRSYNILNLQKSESSIRDTDMAEGIADLMKSCVLLKSRYGLIARPK